MQVLHRAETIIFLLTLLFAAICCHDKDEMLEVVGFVQHPDFAESKIKTSQTFSGFRVTIGCRSKDGNIKTIGSSELNEEEKFKVFLPQETVRDGVIREECYAQVHSAPDSSCPLHNSQEALNIIFQYKSKEKNTIRHSGKLNFSPITCTSKFLWPFHIPKLPHILSPKLYKYTPSLPPILIPETPLTPPFLPSNQPVSTPSPPQLEDLPPAVSPAYINPHPYPPVPVFKHPFPIPSPKLLPHKHYPPAFSTPPIPKSKQQPLLKHKDFSPAPAPSFDTPSSPLPDEPLPLGPSPNGDKDFSSAPAPAPSFDTPASPLPDESLPLGPSTNGNVDFSPARAPSFDTPASPLPDEPLPLAPAPSFDTPASPLPDEPLPLGPSTNGNEDFPPAPAPGLDTPSSPLPHEPLPLGPSPSPLANIPSIPFPPHTPSFTHVPRFTIPQPPPIPSVNKPSPPAS